MSSIQLIFAFIFFWLFLLSFFVVRAVRHYQRLTAGITKRDLKTVLERILANIKTNEKEIKKIIKNLERLEERGSFHLQKIGFLRYNPFKTTGGDQSFILSLLDQHNNGIVLTSFHSRETTRIYAKPVKNGKGERYKLSPDEKKVVDKAKKASLL